MLNDISVNAAEAIPYETFWEKIDIVSQELNKNRYVEVVDELKIVYSERKGDYGKFIPDYGR